eukprot:1191034-Prorocentrum_minimum.AAC.1
MTEPSVGRRRQKKGTSQTGWSTGHKEGPSYWAAGRTGLPRPSGYIPITDHSDVESAASPGVDGQKGLRLQFNRPVKAVLIAVSNYFGGKK